MNGADHTLAHTHVVVTRTCSVEYAVEWNDKHVPVVCLAEQGTNENIQCGFTQPLAQKNPTFYVGHSRRY